MDSTGRNFRIRVEGLTELSKTLRNFANRKAGAIWKAAIQAGAVELGRVAKQYVPVSSGNLKRGIKARGMRTGSYFHAKSLLESTVYYGIMHEVGWHVNRIKRYDPTSKRRWKRTTRPKMKKPAKSRRNYVRAVPARPFMRPAFDTGKERVIAKVGQSMGKAFLREFAKIGRH